MRFGIGNFLQVYVCVLDATGQILHEGPLVNDRVALALLLTHYPAATVAMEAGTHSPWISRYLTGLGATVIVANPRKLHAISRRRRNRFCGFRGEKLTEANTLRYLGMQVAFALPFSMLLLWPVTLYRTNLFYPAMMILLAVLQSSCSRKNCCTPVMELVTTLLVLTMTGAGKTVVQPVGETRLVVDCKANPVALVGHIKITLTPE